MACCGARELAGISYVEAGQEANALWDLCRRQNPQTPTFPRCRYVMFTQASSPTLMSMAGFKKTEGYGYRFASWIEEQGLGSIEHSIPDGINPNSSNNLKMWIWIVDNKGVANWIAEQVKERNYKFEYPAAKVVGARITIDGVPQAPDDVANAAQMFVGEVGGAIGVPVLGPEVVGPVDPANLNPYPGAQGAFMRAAEAEMNELLREAGREARREEHRRWGARGLG